MINSKTIRSQLSDGINTSQPGLCSRDIFENDWHELLNEIDRDVYMESTLSFFDKHLP